MHPEPLQPPLLAVAVLVLAVISNGYAVSLNGRKLASESGGLLKIFGNLNRPLVKGAFMWDLIGTFTSVVGLCALLLYQAWDLLVFDALGAIYAGASQILIEADLDLAESLDTLQIEAVLDELEIRVRAILPNTERVSVQLNSPGAAS